MQLPHSWKTHCLIGLLTIACLCPPLAASSEENSSRFVSKHGLPGVIVFIHGLTGNSKTTWGNQEENVYWPDLIASDSQLNNYFDVYVVNYLSPLFTRAQSIEELTTQLLSELNDAKLFEQYKSVVLIAHSMGGLVAKNMLIKLNTPGEVKKLRQVKTIIYMGTPAQGARGAWWLQWFSWDPQVKDLLPADTNTFLQGIDNNWRQLIDERNRLGEMFPKSFCAYETHRTKGVPIVDRTSAQTWCDSEMQGMPYNHVEIVKPARRDGDVRYEWTRARILQAVPVSSPTITESVCDRSTRIQSVQDNLRPRVRVSVFKHGGSQEAFGQVLGLIKDRLINIRDKLSDPKDGERQYLSTLTECIMDGSLTVDEHTRQRFWDDTYSLELIDGVVFQQPSGDARARSTIYLGALGGNFKQVALDIRVSPDTFGTIKDLYSLATIYALLMDAKRLQKPVAVRLHYLHTALTLSKDIRSPTDDIKQLQKVLKEEAQILKAKRAP
ncbi:MAG: alpha/beta hydrolase [Nitrospira sp.]